MKNQTPKFVIYGQTIKQAFKIMCRRGLFSCEPESQPVLGLLFQDQNDLIACARVFNMGIEVEGDLVIVPAALRSKVEDLVEQLSMEGRVNWIELVGMWFWSSDDELAFNQELDAL
jgi:hypothetical protein